MAESDLEDARKANCRFDHWGAVKSGLQLGVMDAPFIRPARHSGRRGLAR